MLSSAAARARLVARPVILGINTVYHESAACLLRGAEVVAFGEQERFNRVKKGKPARVNNADELPVEAISHCLEQGRRALVGGRSCGRVFRTFTSNAASERSRH